MSGRGRELADVLKRRRINAACLQETKWKGARAREIGEGYKLFYCGSDGKRNGVGIVLDSRLKECVVDVKRVNDRLIAIKLIVDGVTLNLISVYAPQSGCEESVKEKFWEDFDCLLMDLQDSEEVYVGGDFNGHVGKESDGYERVHGGLGFGNRNADGEALLQAACAFDLAITNTWFKKKEEHLITYKSGHHATQIDYFLVRRRSLCCVKNCKVLPGEALVTQHRLILMDFKLSVSPKNSRTRPAPKTRWRMLENDECAIRFRNQILEKMIEMSDMKETLANECWIEMARYIRKVAKDVFGESKGKGLIDRDTLWWNNEVQNVLKEKKVAFKEWQVVKNVNASLKDEKKEVYREFKRRAKKVVAVARAKAQER
ncbi:craniofacial development protein 2-like [Vanessa cardui]|uniref:craniofacial development protein 2-like n=1 Tax=Vanessa cardui TaxID=171605 RepID=UPI001F139685|nr:craniofacial development protein 2-like [Vanessa cardui]